MQIVPKKQRSFHDNVHKSIVLSHPLLLEIVDTPEFQRLKAIEQLQCCSSVFPSANHSRFVHSLGTYHVGTFMVDRLLAQVKDETLDAKHMERARLVVQIAALVHDIGHCAMSHWFDHLFLPILSDKLGDLIHHEHRSIVLFRYMCLEKYKWVSVDNKEDAYLSEQELNLVCHLIQEAKQTEHKSFPSWLEKMPWLCSIVSNPKSGVDCDRMDYLLRDLKSVTSLGTTHTKEHAFDWKKIVDGLRLLQISHFAFDDKAMDEVMLVFLCRRDFHKYLYQHPVVVFKGYLLQQAAVAYLEKNPSVHDKWIAALLDTKTLEWAYTDAFLDAGLFQTLFGSVVRNIPVPKNVSYEWWEDGKRVRNKVAQHFAGVCIEQIATQKVTYGLFPTSIRYQSIPLVTGGSTLVANDIHSCELRIFRVAPDSTAK